MMGEGREKVGFIEKTALRHRRRMREREKVGFIGMRERDVGLY